MSPAPFTAAELEHFRDLWQLADGVAYLNHGSFGPAARPVLAERDRWQAALQRNPMDFFLREMPPQLAQAREKLGEFVGAPADDLLLVENATTGMNIVAETVKLKPGDEVLLNDHEYGAVLRIWQRACDLTGARVVVHKLPAPLESPEQVVDSLEGAITPRTRLLVVSHITSPTALILPVREIIAAAQAKGVPVAVDGPHAVAMLPLHLSELGADFYTASCHKWLSAPFGSGFLYVHPRWQEQAESPLRSWGRLQPGAPPCWRDEFEWLGTRDPAAWLALPAAIQVLGSNPHQAWERFRLTSHAVVREVADHYQGWFQQPALTVGGSTQDDWYGSMVAIPISPGDAPSLQLALWQQYRIEVPIVAWNDRRLLRVSWHLYNQPEDLGRLDRALKELLAG